MISPIPLKCSSEHDWSHVKNKICISFEFLMYFQTLDTQLAHTHTFSREGKEVSGKKTENVWKLLLFWIMREIFY